MAFTAKGSHGCDALTALFCGPVWAEGVPNEEDIRFAESAEEDEEGFFLRGLDIGVKREKMKVLDRKTF